MKVLQTVWSERQNVPDNVFHLLCFAIQRDIVAPKPEGQTVKKSSVSWSTRQNMFALFKSNQNHI